MSVCVPRRRLCIQGECLSRGGGGEGRSLAHLFLGICRHTPCPIIVYFLAHYTPHVSYFWARPFLQDQNKMGAVS